MYVDLTIILNLAVNYFLLKLTSFITDKDSTPLRMLAGSLSGAALIPFLPFYPLLINWVGKTIFPVAMVWLAFRPRRLTQGALACIVFFALSLALGGLLFVLSLQLSPDPGNFGKTATYYIISSASIYNLFFAGSILWAAVFWGKPLLKERLDFRYLFEGLTVTIAFRNLEKSFSAFPDTGNMLKEPVTGYPVAVAAYSAIKELLPREVRNILGEDGSGLNWKKALESLTAVEEATNFRLVPYCSLQEEGMLLAFKPEKITLWSKEGPLDYRGNMIIAIQHGRPGRRAEHEVLLPLEVCRKLEKRDGCQL